MEHRKNAAVRGCISMNLSFAGKGNSSLAEPLIEQVKGGASSLKLHEDWGTTPRAIDFPA